MNKPGSSSPRPAVHFPLPAPEAALKGVGEGVVDTAALNEELDGVKDDPLLLLDGSLTVKGSQQYLSLLGASAGSDHRPVGGHIVRLAHLGGGQEDVGKKGLKLKYGRGGWR